MKFFVTGGAGFIGSHFSDAVLAAGHEVLVFDSFLTGREQFLAQLQNKKGAQIKRGDIRAFEDILPVMAEFKPDWVVHFAANADVRFGAHRPRRDLDFNTIGTWNVAEAARQSGVKNVIFSSTGSVYGEPAVFPTPEDCAFPIQTSLYAASKLAGEGILSAYHNAYQMNVLIFRFVSILGPRYTHGHVVDFMKQLSKDPRKLSVLGDGNQLKSYLHVQDLIAGIMTAIKKVPQGLEILNIGHEDAITVKQSIAYICSETKLDPQIVFAGGTRGWIGDSPRIQLDCSKLKKLGWAPQYSLEASIRTTVKYLQENRALLEEL